MFFQTTGSKIEKVYLITMLILAPLSLDALCRGHVAHLIVCTGVLRRGIKVPRCTAHGAKCAHCTAHMVKSAQVYCTQG